MDGHGANGADGGTHADCVELQKWDGDKWLTVNWHDGLKSCKLYEPVKTSTDGYHCCFLYTDIYSHTQSHADTRHTAHGTQTRSKTHVQYRHTWTEICFDVDDTAIAFNAFKGSHQQAGRWSAQTAQSPNSTMALAMRSATLKHVGLTAMTAVHATCQRPTATTRMRQCLFRALTKATSGTMGKAAKCLALALRPRGVATTGTGCPKARRLHPPARPTARGTPRHHLASICFARIQRQSDNSVTPQPSSCLEPARGH